MSLIRLCVCAYGRVPRFIWVAGKHTPQLSVPVKYVFQQVSLCGERVGSLSA